MPKERQKLSALIITYNEIGYIERCIESVEFADEIIVVDSYSTDGTYEYLKNHPRVKVIQHPFSNFTHQKSFTLKQASNDWVLFLDADEVVPEPLKNEIIETVNSGTDLAAFWFYRKFMFANQPLNFSGWQTDKNYRLFRKSKAWFSDKKIVHETLNVNGESGILKEKLIHYCYKDYHDYKSKMIKYGRLRAKELSQKNKKGSIAKLVLKPFWRFAYNYFVRLGFLDLEKGLIICYLNALSVYVRYQHLYKLEYLAKERKLETVKEHYKITTSEVATT